MTQRHRDVQTHLDSSGFYFGTEWNDLDALNLAHALGRPTPDFGDPDPVRRVSPQEAAEARTNTLSARHGLGAFPFHTETAYWPNPARYLLLHCIHPGAGRRPTLVLDSSQWHLSRADSRRLSTEVFKTVGRKVFLSTLLDSRTPYPAWRFDPECMLPITRGAAQALRFATTLINDSSTLEVDWTPNSVLVIDNHRCLHARGVAQRIDKDRILARMLVAVNS